MKQEESKFFKEYLDERFTNLHYIIDKSNESILEFIKESRKCDEGLKEEINEANENIETLNKETVIIRWFHRNPLKFAGIFIIIVGLASYTIIYIAVNIGFNSLLEMLIKKFIG